MPKYLEMFCSPWQPKNQQLNKHKCDWFYQNTLIDIIIFTKSETMCETLLWESNAESSRVLLTHPLLMQDKYIVAIK